MKLSVILAPYDSGLYHAGCGQGPDAIIAGGLVDELAFRGHHVVVEDIGEVGDAQKREIATGFAVCRAVATKVDMGRDDERFPIVLTGNCLTAAGAVAGDTADSIIWIDQHGDLNTPETSAYGFLDGMALATTLGLCWRPMTSAIPGFQAIDPSRCMLVDARDLDPDERRLLATLPIIRAQWADALDNVGKLKAAGAAQVHLHLDLDVHDPDVLQVNRYARPGGPNPEQLRQLVCGLAKSIPIVGVTLSAYDPAFDAKGEVPPVVGQLLGDFLAALARI
ncbi:arginase family protein [Mesorhizobium wenxiniae]|uniref:Arginase n=1 Tax=Mesorhizobium wenxiniae TaxID=2014805 RepID=A0A271KM44_9HYPH|nr:arginase family protein [Mesorhizobium wenxiniae]PAP96780.1 arginase [Mesorhizobium wenxiniae]